MSRSDFIRNLLVLTAGISIGWIGSRMLGPTSRPPQISGFDSVTKRKSTLPTAESDARLPGSRSRSDETTHEQAAFNARLKAALADSPVEASLSPQKPPNDRFSTWLAGVSLPPSQKEEIRAKLETLLTAGDEDPLTAGSSFDQWLRNFIDADALVSWTANQNAHSADRIERRANRLLVDLQGSLSLTSEQKDSIYPQLVAWARENPKTILGDDSKDADGQEKSFAARLEKISALVPTEQREALAEWVAEFLPTYCLEESD